MYTSCLHHLYTVYTDIAVLCSKVQYGTVQSSTYLPSYLATYLPTYIDIHTYVRTYVRTYVHTYIHTYIHPHIHALIHKPATTSHLRPKTTQVSPGGSPGLPVAFRLLNALRLTETTPSAYVIRRKLI